MSAAPEKGPGATGRGAPPLLEVRDLCVHFPVRRGLLQRVVGTVRAVDGVSFEISSGRTLGLVGESGCGKSTTGRALLQLVRPTTGSVRLDGVELVTLSGEALRRARRHAQMIFQDPYASLNPRMSVLETLAEPLVVHGLARRPRDAVPEVLRLLERVGLEAGFLDRFPHEFSGGQRQRIGIARALALRPRLILADEPVSALDVSVQAQILNLLAELQRDLGLAFLFISHDLAAVRHVSHEVAVMYLGRIVERADVEGIFRAPRHPYTQALLSAIPVPDPAAERRRRRIPLLGEVPSALARPSGCAFHPRCPFVLARCRTETPALLPREDGRLVACHLDEAATVADARTVSS